MTRKIVKLAAVTLFSACSLMLLGSLPMQHNAPASQTKSEINKINNTLNAGLNSDFSELQQKNPLILLEFTVE